MTVTIHPMACPTERTETVVHLIGTPAEILLDEGVLLDKIIFLIENLAYLQVDEAFNNCNNLPISGFIVGKMVQLSKA